MTRIQPEEFGRWSVEGLQRSIDYSQAVMQDIRAAVMEGYYKIPHGGVGVGGVLFGRREDGVVRIFASRPLACEYLTGPSFALSEKDRAALATLLETYAADVALQGLVPVGWYLSHTRSGILLTEGDLEIYRRFFPEPWQVCLVLRPDRTKAMRAGFFIREPDGRVRADSSYREFALDAVTRTKGTEAASEIPLAIPAAAPSRRWLWWVLTALLVVAAFVAGALVSRTFWPAAS